MCDSTNRRLTYVVLGGPTRRRIHNCQFVLSPTYKKLISTWRSIHPFMFMYSQAQYNISISLITSRMLAINLEVPIQLLWTAVFKTWLLRHKTIFLHLKGVTRFKYYLLLNSSVWTGSKFFGNFLSNFTISHRFRVLLKFCLEDSDHWKSGWAGHLPRPWGVPLRLLETLREYTRLSDLCFLIWYGDWPSLCTFAFIT